jgi:hypothetical protein
VCASAAWYRLTLGWYVVHEVIVYILNRHYKNVINKLRSDIKEEYTKIESNFYNEPKLRGIEICGRDKWKWYKETDEVAQVLVLLKSILLDKFVVRD